METVGDRLPALIVEARSMRSFVDGLVGGSCVMLDMAIERAELAVRDQDVILMIRSIKELEGWLG